MEKSRNYPDFDKINTCVAATYLNDPNMDLLPQLEDWCAKHDLKIENSSIYKEAIRIVPIKDCLEFNFEEHLSTLELFSL